MRLRGFRLGPTRLPSCCNECSIPVKMIAPGDAKSVPLRRAWQPGQRGVHRTVRRVTPDEQRQGLRTNATIFGQAGYEKCSGRWKRGELSKQEGPENARCRRGTSPALFHTYRPRYAWRATDEYRDHQAVKPKYRHSGSGSQRFPTTTRMPNTAIRAAFRTARNSSESNSSAGGRKARHRLTQGRQRDGVALQPRQGWFN